MESMTELMEKHGYKRNEGYPEARKEKEGEVLIYSGRFDSEYALH